MLRVAWYRFRSTFGRRWGGLFAIVLLVGLVGGLALGAFAGARRTQSSFPVYLARTHASDLAIGNAIYDPQNGSDTAFDAGLVARIVGLAHVKRVADFTIVDPNLLPLGPFNLHTVPGETPPVIGGSVDGEYSTLDRVTLASGRLADPRRLDEVVMSASAARELGMHLGSVLPIGFVTNKQLQSVGGSSGKAKLAPHIKVDLKLVGIVVLNSEIVEDDVDALGDNPVLLSPALMRELVPCCSFVTNSLIEVDGGRREVPAVQAEIARDPALKASGLISSEVVTSPFVAKAERAIEPESIALGVFGLLAALAALLIAAQLIGRELRVGVNERAVLRALGATPATAVGDGLFGVVGAIVVGALLACVVAVGLSPLAPLGPVRRVEHPSIAFDWTAIGLGFAVLVVVLSAVAVAVAYRSAPHRLIRRRERAHTRGSRAARAAANTGLPTPAVTGIRFALEPGSGPSAVPVRSAIIGAVLAVVVVTSTLTFGSSLQALVSHPALYGWNWNYQLLAGFSGAENLPQPQVTALLDHDPYVSAWTGVYFGDAEIDGRTVAYLGTSPNASVGPPLLTGHGVDATNQVVLGATTLADLHKHVGDTVVVDTGQKHPTTLHIVGTATMPAIGGSGGGNLHTTMGTGAVFSYQLIPANQRNYPGIAIAGPNAVLIRVRNSANPVTALHSLQQINNTLSKGPDGPTGGVTGVLRPAEIVNYRTMGTTPALLGAALAIGATAALTLTLITSVRRRRRELALLKTLGFTRRQLAAVVAWQSTIAVAIGVAIGIPIGVILGRSLWDLFAHAIHAVPEPTVPALTIALVGAGALVLANLVAAIPALQAAHIPTAVLLHAE